LNDDIFKKLKSLLTGSISIASDMENKFEKENNSDSEDLINNFMDQILDATWVEDELKNTISPSYHLSKKQKSYWLLNISLKTLMNIKSGVEIFPVEKGEKNTVCMIGHAMYSIPNDILICSGWN
jgi:hypothetical protein